MFKMIKNYKLLSFEDKTLFAAKFSIVLNSMLAIGKIVLSIFNGIFFLVAGIFNLFILIAKLECYLGIRRPKEKEFFQRNNMIATFVLLAGLQYAIYMARLIFTDVESTNYNMVLGISIATISFIELAIAIKGCFNAYGRGHYFRNIKLINLCSALTAIVLTEVAITSFAAENDTRVINGIFGMVIGAIIVLIAIFMYIAPKVSIIDREHNVYQLKEKAIAITNEKIEIKLTGSKFYGNYIYVGKAIDDKIDGHIIKEKSPIFNWNIYIKILIIVLSEILIFVYALGALIFYFKSAKIIKILDGEMLKINYKKIIEEQQVVR